MTARVYRAEDARWLDAPDVLGWWWVLCPDGSVRGVDVTSITCVHAGGAETLTAVCVGPSIPARPLDWRRYRWQRATPPSTDAPDCGTTHHTGCACHEARRDARERDLVAEVKDLRTGLGYFGGRDDERIDALESALRASLARWRAARGRFDPLPHCDVCGVRLAADGTEPYGGEHVLLATILRAMNEEALVEAGQNSLDREVYLIQQIVNLLHDSSGTRARRVLGYILSRVADLP